MLTAWGQNYVPKGVLVLSSTWVTKSPAIGTTTIQLLDYQFPNPTKKQLRMVYPAARAPQMAEHILPLLQEAYPKAHQKQRKPLDYGAWMPLYHLFPSALIPVLQLSVPTFEHPQESVAFGRVLADISKDRYLIVLSDSEPQFSPLFWIAIGAAERLSYPAQYLSPPVDADIPLTALSFSAS